MEKKYITHKALADWLFRLDSDVLAPVSVNGETDFRQVKSMDEISTDHVQTVQSAKEVAFPRTEKLFSYIKQKNDVELRDFDADAIRQTVVFGIRPCDAAGFGPLSGIFNWDTPDKPFNERMKRTALIAVSCTECDESCFCTSVGGGPGNTAGNDILLTPIGEGYLAEIVTEKGKKLTEKYGDFFESAPDVDKNEYLAKVDVRFDVEELSRKIGSMFENRVWKQQSLRCLGCGACAYVCPTCACFDIQEDARGSSGRRLRCWDSCGFTLFTKHTSGHNPRETQGQRWRQRLLHKFAYMPERISLRGCTGCGRCSRACPVDMNIADHLTEIAQL